MQWMDLGVWEVILNLCTVHDLLNLSCVSRSAYNIAHSVRFQQDVKLVERLSDVQQYASAWRNLKFTYSPTTEQASLN